MINNINPLKNPFTTITGIVLIFISLGMFISPMFIEIKESVDVSVASGIGIVGLALVLVPDDLKGGLVKLIGRKSDDL